MSYLGSTPASQFFAPGTDTFSGDGTTVAFTLSRNVATVNDILVVVNNVDQQPSNYTVLNNVLTFSPAPSAGTNNIYVRYLSTNITAIVPSASGTANSTTFLRGDNTWAVVSVTPTAVSDQANTSIGYFDLPSGTTAQRPASPPTGGSRFNTTTGFPEYYDGTTWWQFNSAKIYTTQYLVVAGGGAGGFDSAGNGGGGGAGGYLSGSSQLTVGATYSVTIGAGGSTAGSGTVGGSGSSSVFVSVATSVGGGGGGTYSGVVGASGGSGGGAGQVPGGAPGAGTSGQGNAGGTNTGISSAGGGGAGAVGGSSSTAIAGNGGVGLNWQSLGTFYAGGGGGSNHGSAGSQGGLGGNGGGGNGHYGAAAGTAGTANTGGGGGGGGENKASGAGGSGVVIFLVPTINYSGITTGSPTISTSGSNTIIKFTSSGTYTA